MALYKRGARWWSRIQRSGEVFQRSTGCENKNDARDVESVWKAEMARGEVGLYRAPTVCTFSERFLNYLPGRVSPRTFQFYVDAWRHVTESKSLANVRLDKIDGEKIEQFIKERRAAEYRRGEKGIARTVSATTINHSLRTLRRATHLAAEWNLIRRAPKISLLRGEVSREHVIDETTLSRFLSLCESTEPANTPFAARRFHPEMRAVLIVLIDSGLRVGELCRLDWSDVNFEGQGSIFVRVGKTKHARRTVPLTARAKAVLSEMPRNGSNAVFLRNGKRIDEGWATHQFTALRRALGLPDGMVLHSLRHSAASKIAAAGASPFVLQKLLGWSIIQIAARYCHSDSSQLERAMANTEI